MAPTARSWRNIPQQVKPRAMSPEGHRRLIGRVLRVGGAAAVLAIMGWGLWQTIAALENSPQSLSGSPAPSIAAVVLVTDGVLDRAWLVHQLALPKKAGLMSLDLEQLRARVMASRQVETAAIIRNFPATLQVRISERTPVARVLVQDGAAAAKALLVARDGVVFEGAGYDFPMLDSLPWLDGTKLARRNGGYAPIEGMDTVAELLARAKLEAENLYRDWHVVSLARLASDGEIEVRTREGLTVIFGTQEDFFRQLARLDLLLESARSRGAAQVSQIDLSLGNQVPMTFEAAAPAAVSVPASEPTPSFFPNSKPREL
jgi:cell division protein FtsQ